MQFANLRSGVSSPVASAEISQSWRLPYSARPIKPGEPYVLGFGFTWSARAHYKCLTISACKPACQPSRRRVGLLLALSAPSYWARLFWVKGLIESSRASFLSCDAEGYILIFSKSKFVPVRRGRVHQTPRRAWNACSASGKVSDLGAILP